MSIIKLKLMLTLILAVALCYCNHSFSKDLKLGELQTRLSIYSKLVYISRQGHPD